MFIVSVKSAMIKKIFFAVSVIAVAIIGGTVSVMSEKSVSVGSFSDVSLNGGTDAERKAFFESFGWEISDDPLEVKETVIPDEFSESYAEYNELQKMQNFNLEKYRGTRVKFWSYEILNYPGYENSDGVIRGNLLTCNGKIIGGDVCSIELGGFMHGFTPEIAIKSTEDSSSLPQEE